MAKAYVFPGQGAQFVGMGKDLYNSNEQAKALFEKANEILGFRITDLMFEGTEDDLKQTKVTQPAVFLCSVIPALCANVEPDMVAGHSLGEFSALVAAGALSFEDGLKLVSQRAQAMQKACEAAPSTMAAIIGLPDEKIEEICASISKEGNIVVPANYNNPGQLVISGNVEAINEAIDALTLKGADYTDVDKAIDLANAYAVNKELYTNYDAVEAAVAAVIRDLAIDKQTDVDAMAKAINDAIVDLVEADADYKELNKVMERIPSKKSS